MKKSFHNFPCWFSLYTMPPKGVSKAVNKKCPECKKLNPVATKHCQCGHQFFEERRRSTASNHSEQEEGEEGMLKEGRDLKGQRGIMGEGNKGSVSGESGLPAVEGKRRSERVKREKPNFYDSLEYDNQMRKARRERQKEEQQQQQQHYSSGRVKRERKVKNSSEQEDDDDDEPVKERKRRKKKKSSSVEKKEMEEDEDIMAGISAEKEWQFSMVLADINLKLGLNNPAFITI